MDKQGKIAVILICVVMFGWTIYQAKVNPPQPGPAATPTPTPAVASGTSRPLTSAPGTVNPAVPAPTPEPVLPEETKEINTAQVDYTFTNHGGGIAHAELNNHFVGGEGKKHIVLNDYNTVPIGAISDQPGEDAATASYTTLQDEKDGISYQRTTSQQLQITKKFTVPTATEGVEQYIATLDLSIINSGTAPYKSDGYYIYLGSASPIHINDTPRYIAMDYYLNGKASEINVSSFGASKIPMFGSPEKSEITATGDNIAWAGVYSQYFTTIMTPVVAPDSKGANRIWSNRLPVDLDTHQSGGQWLHSNPPGTIPKWYAINGALGMPGFDLAPGKTYSQQFTIYLGPRQDDLLKNMGQGQAAIMQLGYSAPISKLLLKLLKWMQKVVGSYAVAIIVLTIIIKLLMWPLQNRSTQSMKKMQALNPKMTELREKYKDDPAKLNQETIKLYKTYGVNPLAGCLPMFIQLPIFVGFYSMLGSAIELRNSQFFWVHDLSQPDTVGHILGFSINILPLCMAATSAWMMAMTPKSGDASQQKMMMFMPLLFLWICYSYASGLALYMMVSNLFSVVQFIVTKKSTAPSMQKVALPVTGKKKR